jgi:hypothetical protein
MPKQSPLRIVKRWKRYEPRQTARTLPGNTRGLYVLYRKKTDDEYEVVYIGVAGLGPDGGGGIRGRLRRHAVARRGHRPRNTKDWTHYSAFEVHDNITSDEIRELEAVLLAIFRHDSRVGLANKQKGSKKLSDLRHRLQWH